MPFDLKIQLQYTLFKTVRTYLTIQSFDINGPLKHYISGIGSAEIYHGLTFKMHKRMVNLKGLREVNL
jgi:hypothetical protein